MESTSDKAGIKWVKNNILIIGIVLSAIGFTGRILGHDPYGEHLNDWVALSDMAGKILTTVWFTKWFAKKLSKPNAFGIKWEKKSVLITGIVLLFIGFVFNRISVIPFLPGILIISGWMLARKNKKNKVMAEEDFDNVIRCDDVVLREEDRMKCPTCGEQNAIDMATCVNCGHEL